MHTATYITFYCLHKPSEKSDTVYPLKSEKVAQYFLGSLSMIYHLPV